MLCLKKLMKKLALFLTNIIRINATGYVFLQYMENGETRYDDDEIYRLLFQKKPFNFIIMVNILGISLT